MESGRIGGGSPYRGYPQSIPDVKNNDIDIENVGDESGQFSDFEILGDMDVESFESTDEGAKRFMLSLVDYEYNTDPEIIDAKSTFEFVRNLTMKDGLWRHVCINGDIDPDIIAAIPQDIAYIYIGARATSNCIKAIPSHIRIVKICIGVDSEAVAALPESVFAVFIANGVSPCTVKSLPTHIEIAVVEDVTCQLPMQCREVIGKGGAVLQNGVAKLGGELRQNKIATLDALPSHVTEILEMDQVIIARDKSKAFATLKYTYTNGTTESPSTCSSVMNTTSLNNLNEMESFFDVKRPSALKVTDIKTANGLLSTRIDKGWRWVASEFISDTGYNEKTGYSGYRVETTENEPTENSFISNDFIIDLGMTIESNFTTFIPSFFINRHTNEREMVFTSSNDTQYVRSLLDVSKNLSIKSNNPVTISKQVPTLSVGDWIVMQGKTMRLLKASNTSQHEKGLYQALEANLKKIINNDPSKRWANLIHPGELPIYFFKNTYTRLAGAYLRRLERSHHLQEAYQKFFSITKINLAEQQQFSVLLYGRDKLTYPNNFFYKVELKKSHLTVEDSELLCQALGISINIEEGSTVENTIPFKKVLEILSACNGSRKLEAPLLVNLNMFGRENVQFLLTPHCDQLLVSTNKNTLTFTKNNMLNGGDLRFGAHAYPYFFSGKEKFSAKEADVTLKSPISESKKPIRNPLLLIEFLVCTQVAEAYFTPGNLSGSRVPGANKLARSLIEKAATDKLPLSELFKYDERNENRGFFPMAGDGGTKNTRHAVNALRRTGNQNVSRSDNATDYEMSDDSDV